MRPALVDLHTHTNASDGADSPSAVVQLAVKAGLSAVAITDHDTLSGLDEAEEEGKRLHITVVRGCELSTTVEYGEVHILGLWIPHHCEVLEKRFVALQERRKRRNKQMIERINALGMSLSMDDVLEQASGESVGRPHIAQAMVAKGYVSTYNDAFQRYLGRGKAAFIPMEPFAPEDAVKLLSSVGATSAFAHPMLLRCPYDWRENLIAKLAQTGLSALEAYHSEHSQEDERTLVNLAQKYNLGLTGGSDYHGASKNTVQIGCGHGSLRVSKAIFDLLVARRVAQGLEV